MNEMKRLEARYGTGLTKLKGAEEAVHALQVSLKEQEPELKKADEETKI